MVAKTFDLFWEEKVSGGGREEVESLGLLCGSSRWTVAYSKKKQNIPGERRQVTYLYLRTLLISTAGFVAQRIQSCLMQPVLGVLRT